jgi:hypothetical protein
MSLPFAGTVKAVCCASYPNNNILTVFRIRIRYPGFAAFLTPGSRDPGGMNNPIIFPRAKKQFFGVKMLKFFDADPEWKKFGSGMEKFWFHDPG